MEIDKRKFEFPVGKNLQIKLDLRVKAALATERRKLCMSEGDFVNATLYQAFVESNAIPHFAKPENEC